MPRLARGSNLSRSTRKARSSNNLRQHAVVSCSNIATRNNNFDSELASKFDRSLQSLAYVTCTNCKVKCLQETKENFLCTTCRRDQNMLTAVNNMDLGDVPPQLQDLSPAEQMLIAKVQPVMRLYQYRSSGQLFYNGHVINIAQDLSEITNLLPRSPRSINVVIVRRATAEGFLEFRVRRQKVLDALTFLKNNNDFYNDINIDMNTLNDLPFDGTIEDEVPTTQIDNEQNEMPEGGLVTESAVSNIVFQNQREAVQRILEWPTGNPNPINEFHTPGYIVMAFPHLFPWGKADFNDHTRQTKLSFKQWCNFLIHFRDSRFATDKRFRYFCLNTMQRHEALDSGSIMAKKSDLGELTIDQLRTEFERNPGILNKLLAYGAHIRGTNAYWFKRRNELQAMCETLGAPTIFLTLSSADLWWPCMQKYFNIDQTILENERHMSLLMQKSLNDNPLIADEYFGIRVQIFMDILNEKFKVTDFWYRTEYQHRGSPHVHCLIWIEGAPDIRLFDSATIDEINSYRKFYDQLVSAVNPNQNEPPAVIHPSRLYGSTVEFGNVEKQAQLLNRVQRHTQHSIYCQRKVCGGLKCRFGYPKKIEEDSHLERNEKDEWVHTPKRNDELINDHNPFITHVWRANTDCKVVTSLQMVVNYLAKYAAKSEPASQSFRDTFSDILHSSEPTNNATTALQRTLMKLIGQRDISACEVMRLLTGEPLYHSSRQFITLYISNEDIVVLNEDGSHGSTALTKYLNRPRAAETLTLYQFTSSCNTNSRLERLTYYRKSRIVQVLPKVTLGVSEEYDELFYMQKVLIASVFRDIIEAKTHRTWHESFTHLDVGWWDFNGIANQEDEVEVVNPEIENVPWMEIAAVHPNVIPAHVHPGEREIDRDHDWFENISDYENINENVNFVKRVKEITQLESTRTHSSSVPLNNEQQQIIDQLTLQLNGLTNIKRTLITGPAGVGKSVVINKIVNITQSHFGDGSVLVLAPTGCAASNINGQTIHSALRLNIRNFSELQGENERNVQALFQNIRVVVCDEVSMCGQKLLAMIDKRLRQAKPENQDEVFGGLIVYLCGDMAQLLPVQDRALFMPADLSNQWYTHGRYVYEQIQKLFELKTIMRQSGEEQSDFRNALSHIANGTVTDEDYTFFASRFISKNISTVSEFGNAIRIMARKEDVAAHNLNELAKLQNPVAFIRAINKPAIAATASSDECHFLENVIRLSKGCRVMLRHNLWTEAGLVNGAVGTVQDILYERVEGVSHLDLQPLCVLVEFYNYIGPTIYNNVVPISPVVTSFLKRGTKCTRKQFPLILAYSITIHKSQGMTLNQAVVDIGPREFSAGLTYVAVSRVRTVGGLLFDPGFPRDRLMKINSSSVWQHKRSDYMRLKTLS